MATPSETFRKFKNDLDPYIKPREQVNYIRRILALHLGSSLHDGPIQEPLALMSSPQDMKAVPEATGVQKEFLDALRENGAAQRQFQDLFLASKAQTTELSTPSTLAQAGSDFLNSHITLLKSQRKRENLLVVQKYLQILAEKPASTEDFFDTTQMFIDTAQLPEIPKDLINSLVAEQSNSKPDLVNRVNQLEKTVLRAKLLLRNDEISLREARDRCTIRSDVVSNGAKLEALDVTRNELIGWIENELGKVSGEGDDDDMAGGGRENHWQSQTNQPTVMAQLEIIRGKYTKYLASRKHILTLVAQKPAPLVPPPVENVSVQSRNEAPGAEPVDHLLTPYLERLLAVSRRQKATISHKSHASSSLSHQSKETSRQLSRLAQESQLLHKYPMKDKLRRRSGIINDVTTLSDYPDISAQVKPWIFAADSAKMATLESVAEHIEKGQLALENSMASLAGIDTLLGKTGDETTASPDEDVWLDRDGGSTTDARKHTMKKREQASGPTDIWSAIHGNLGLIGHDDVI